MTARSSVEASDFVKNATQKHGASFREDRSLSAQFVEGIANICIDLRIKDNGDIIRVWLVHRSETDANPIPFNMAVRVVGDEGYVEDAACIIADVGIENIDGIQKGFMGLGVFQSIMTQTVLEISPPFWWSTGNPRVDASTRLRQNVEDNSDRFPDSLRYRYPISDVLLSQLGSLRVTVCSWGLDIKIGDERLELVDASVGPFNTR